MGDAGRVLVVWRGGKRGMSALFLEKNRVHGARKKSHGKREGGGACRGYNKFKG